MLLLVLYAAAPQKGDRKNPCASASTQLEMNRCWSNAAKSAEEQVSHAVAEVSAKVDRGEHSERIKLIETSQAKWEEYRDAACAVIGDLYEGGSMQPLQDAQCRLRLAEQRKVEVNLMSRELARRAAENAK
jgi:uncharacterized protein YecT (DUF1311 family)